MKVRITDLLDLYYDDSIKLTPPEEIFAEKTEKTGMGQRQEKPAPLGRGYKIWTAAAILLLVLTGAFALMLSLQPKAGTSLSEGTAPIPSFGTQVPDRPEMAPSVEEESSLVPQPGIIGEIALPEKFSDVHLLSYTQRGSSVSMEYSVENMDAFSQEEGWTVTAVTGITGLDDVRIDPNSQAEFVGSIALEAYLDEGSGTLYVYGNADMTGEDWAPDISLLIRDGEGEARAVTYSTTVPYNAGTAFAVGSDDHHIFDFEDGEFSAGITDFHISKDKKITIMIDYPLDETIPYPDPESEGSVLARLNYWTGLLMETLGSTSPIAIYTETEEGPWNSFNIDFSQLDYTVTLPQYQDGQIDVDCSGVDFDPEQVVNIEFHSPSMSEAETAEGVPNDGDLSAAEDTDGDGYLTADLDLTLEQNGEEGTLARLHIDRTTGEYTWTYSIPALVQQLYNLSPEGDFNAALEDDSFANAHTEWKNAFLEAYQTVTYLVFTDGSRSIALGGGSVVGYDDNGERESLLYDADNLNWLGEDAGTDYSQKTISYLEINGVRYVFY